MKVPPNADETGGRLTGEVMSEYLESFTKKFLPHQILYRTDVVNVRRPEKEPREGWMLTVKNLNTGISSELYYSKIVLCTGVRINVVGVRFHADHCQLRVAVILVFHPISHHKQPRLLDFEALSSILVSSVRSYQTSWKLSNPLLSSQTRIQEG